MPCLIKFSEAGAVTVSLLTNQELLVWWTVGQSTKENESKNVCQNMISQNDEAEIVCVCFSFKHNTL